jgi:hypothetical protein
MLCKNRELLITLPNGLPYRSECAVCYNEKVINSNRVLMLLGTNERPACARIECIFFRGAKGEFLDRYCSATDETLLKAQALREPALLVRTLKVFIRWGDEPVNAKCKSKGSYLLRRNSKYQSSFTNGLHAYWLPYYFITTNKNS